MPRGRRACVIKFASVVIVPLCLLCLLTATAHAGDAGPETAPAVSAASSAGAVDLVADMVQSIRAGNWRYAAAFALSLLVLAFGGVRDRVKWFRGDRGGVVAIFVLSFGGALATSLLGSAPIDATMALTSVSVAVTAIGGFTAFKRFLWPKDSGGS